MKKISFWVIMFLAISLTFLFYSTAQTQTKLILESPSGNRIGTPSITSFSMGTDNTLVIYLAEPFNFVSLDPPIQVDGAPGSYSGCTVSPPATVTATQGSNLSFKIKSAATNATLSMVVDPEGLPYTSFDTTTGVFKWDAAQTAEHQAVPVGSYLAVFQASVGTQEIDYKTSQLVVMVKIVSPVQQYNVTTSVYPIGAGTVTGAGTYNAGTPVTVSATESSGYAFSYWSEGASAITITANPYTFTISDNRNLVANFTPSTQPPPPPTSPPPGAVNWVWGKDVRLEMLPGSQQTYIVGVGSNYYRLNLDIYGLSNETNAEFSWTFPDGRIFPTAGTGKADIIATNSRGMLILRAGSNIPDSVIPLGNHTFTINAKGSSFMTIRLECPY